MTKKKAPETKEIKAAKTIEKANGHKPEDLETTKKTPIEVQAPLVAATAAPVVVTQTHPVIAADSYAPSLRCLGQPKGIAQGEDHIFKARLADPKPGDPCPICKSIFVLD